MDSLCFVNNVTLLTDFLDLEAEFIHILLAVRFHLIFGEKSSLFELGHTLLSELAVLVEVVVSVLRKLLTLTLHWSCRSRVLSGLRTSRSKPPLFLHGTPGHEDCLDALLLVLICFLLFLLAQRPNLPY